MTDANAAPATPAAESPDEETFETIPRGPETPPIDPASLPKVYPALKRVLEFPVALGMFLAMSPLLMGVTLGAWVSHGFPALFRFPRMGRGNLPFSIFKFRTMVVGAKEKQEQGAPHHELITRYGEFLRNTHLDEVAQILNVLKGDVSFVGPRPIDQDTWTYLCEENEIWPDVLMTRPGITCIESIIADLPEKEEKIRRLLKIPPAPAEPFTVTLPRRYPLDRHYIATESLWTDLVCVWYTVYTIAGRAKPHT